MKRIVLNIILVITNILFFNSCDAPNLVDNPLPFLEFTSAPAPGSVISIDHLLIQWSGNNSNYEFTYKLLLMDDSGIYRTYIADSNLSSSQEVYLKNLDEGNYEIQVTGFSFGVQATISRDFSVNVLTQPTLGFFKKYSAINIHDTTSIYVTINNIDSIAALKLDIVFSNDIIQLLNVEDGPYVIENRFTQITLPGDLKIVNSNSVMQANSKGKIEINTGFLSTLSSNFSNSLSGTGKILKLNFIGINNGQANIEFSSIELYDFLGNKISNTANEIGIIQVGDSSY